MSKAWKEIKGYEGRYLISSSGDVISLNYGKRGFAKALTWKVNNKGYAWVELRGNGVRDIRLIHRLVAENFLENPEGFETINHKDENPLRLFVERGGRPSSRLENPLQLLFGRLSPIVFSN